MKILIPRNLLKQATVVLPVALVSLFASANAYGAIITLDSTFTNPSFEANPDDLNCPTGWTCGGSPSPGFTSYVVTAAQYTAGSDGIPGLVPFGVAAASSPTPVEGSGTLSQTGLGTYTAGNSYVVNLWIGTPKTLPSDNTTPTAQVGRIQGIFLGTGGAALSTIDLTIPAVGQWISSPLSFTPTGAQLGQTIGFELFVDSTPPGGGSGNNRIANFDIGGAAVPEPGTLGLLGLGLLGFGMARRKLNS